MSEIEKNKPEELYFDASIIMLKNLVIDEPIGISVVERRFTDFLGTKKNININKVHDLIKDYELLKKAHSLDFKDIKLDFLRHIIGEFDEMYKSIFNIKEDYITSKYSEIKQNPVYLLRSELDYESLLEYKK